MQKLNTQTPDLTEQKIADIAKIFPSAVTEKESPDGTITKAVDFDLLRQELSKNIVEDGEERYRLDWPGKKASLLKANTPINKTLRPVREDSVNFDTTENIYIEGDNFEALKILQESYLGKVDVIYTDPPYNTRTSMIYNNDFSIEKETYEKELGAEDSEGYKMFKNTESNGRFHSDWLSMMYERIIISRDILSDNGFFIIAIDHNELHNLTSICDQIFGEDNRIATVVVQHNPKGRNQAEFFSENIEYMIVYAKNKQRAKFNKVAISEKVLKSFDKSDDQGKFRYENYLRARTSWSRGKKPNNWYPLYVSKDLSKITSNFTEGYYEIYPTTGRGEFSWKNIKESFDDLNKKSEYFIAKKLGDKVVILHKYYEQQVLKNIWIDKKYQSEFNGTNLLKKLFNENIFDFPKSLYLVEDILKLTSPKNGVILDYFSGSATTAHSVIDLNALDGGTRKFIVIQIPEKTEEGSTAHKAGYKNISQIGKERIRRAGKKILEENKDKEGIDKLDVGFRVYRVDSTNYADVAIHPSDTVQESLLSTIDNIKSDRTPEDLLTEVILSLGLELSLPITRKQIDYKEVFFVAENSLVACFDQDITEKLIEEIASIQPLKAVFRDSSFKDDKDRINFENKFKGVSPDTEISVI